MKFVRHVVLTAATGLTAVSGAVAQSGSTGTASGSSSASAAGSGSTGSSSSITLESTPLISGVSDSGTGASGVNSSNPFGMYYANPQYQGRAGASNGDAPGGFGAALYGTTGTTTGTTSRGTTGAFGASTARAGATTSTLGRTTTSGIGMTGRTTTGGIGGTTGGFGGTTGGFGGTTGGFGGTTGGFGGAGRTGGFGGTTGGFGGTTSGFGRTGGTSAIVARQPRAMVTPAVLAFRPAPVAPARVQSDLQAVLARSTMISNPRGVQLATEGPVVVLRGTVRDEDEARLVEGMVRLTPGVRDVRNELTFAPTPTVP